MVVVVIKASGLRAGVVGDCCFWMLWSLKKITCIINLINDLHHKPGLANLKHGDDH